VARGIKAFITTKRFGDPPYYSNGLAASLSAHTARASAFSRASRRLLDPIYRNGYDYKKAGVCLYDIRPSRPHQESLFGRDRETDEALMGAVDQITREHGKNALNLAAAGMPSERDWAMKRQNRSPRYTTRWDELPTAKA
jgi:DNA polymerase V